MSAAIHKDRTGRNRQDVTGLDKQLIYMTRLSREVGLACDEFLAKRNCCKPYGMKEIITSHIKRGKP